MTNKEAIALGFKLERHLKNVNEYLAIKTDELVKTLEEKGFTKVWGSEGCVDAYAIFTCDNKQHEDYGKTFISITVLKDN